MRNCEVTNIIPLANTKRQQDRQITGLIKQMILRSNKNAKKGSQKAKKKASSQKAKKKPNSQKAKKKASSQKARKKAKKKPNSQKARKNFRTNGGSVLYGKHPGLIGSIFLPAMGDILAPIGL